MLSKSNFLRPVLGLAVALTAFAAVTSAESSPEAREWLNKMVAVYDQGPLTMDYTASLDLHQMGQPIRGDLDGKITYGDRRHTRMELRMVLTGLADGSEDEPAPMELSMLTIADGEVIWTELDMESMGRQVMKISIEDAAKLSSESTGGFAGNPAGMDPVAQLQMLTEKVDFEVGEVSAGRVTLRGTVNPESREALGQLGALGADTFVLVIDAETAFPIELRAGEPEPVIRMEFQNPKRVSREALPDGIFDYTPPEGVAVTDLAATLGGAGR